MTTQHRYDIDAERLYDEGWRIEGLPGDWPAASLFVAPGERRDFVVVMIPVGHMTMDAVKALVIRWLVNLKPLLPMLSFGKDLLRGTHR